MSRAFFFDTSALLKLYHREVGTDQVEEIFKQTENSIVISELAIVEFYSTLARKVRTGEITPQAQEEASRDFENDCVQRFVIDPLSGAVIQRAKELLQKPGNTRPLRSLDSLQLGTCLTARRREELIFVCADARLLQVAESEGLQTENPEPASL